MNDEYIIRFLLDDEYELVKKSNNETVLQGTLQDINAYLDLRAKGFEL